MQLFQRSLHGTLRAKRFKTTHIKLLPFFKFQLKKQHFMSSAIKVSTDLTPSVSLTTKNETKMVSESFVNPLESLQRLSSSKKVSLHSLEPEHLLSHDTHIWVGIQSREQVKNIKVALEKAGLFDRRRKIVSLTTQFSPQAIKFCDVFPGCAAVAPVLRALVRCELPAELAIEPETGYLKLTEDESLRNAEVSGNEKIRCASICLEESPHNGLAKDRYSSSSFKKRMLDVFHKHSKPKDEIFSNISTSEISCSLLPQKWERLGDLVLIPEPPGLPPLGEAFYNDLATVFKCRGIGLVGRVTGDRRESQSRLVYVKQTSESPGVVHHKEHGITFAFDVTQCMFSSGNGTERNRLVQVINTWGATTSQRANHIVCHNAIFVDMYCGIGYFTLGIMVKCPCVKEVWACDWNPTALKFLQQALPLNNISEDIAASKLRLLCGDSRTLGSTMGLDRGTLRGRADRISLGLLPSSEEGWRAAVRMVNAEGAFLHIHGLAPKRDTDQFTTKIIDVLKRLFDEERNDLLWSISLFHLQRVKSFCPYQYHVVADVYCSASAK